MDKMELTLHKEYYGRSKTEWWGWYIYHGTYWQAKHDGVLVHDMELVYLGYRLYEWNGTEWAHLLTSTEKEFGSLIIK